MTVDPNNPVPIFEQIVAGLCADVTAGVYRPGELVPSVRQQAVALRVNPNTVQRAYEQLERDGLLAGRRGTGMEVTTNAPALAAAHIAITVRQTFVRGIEAGRAAKLGRAEIDALYDRGWKRGSPREGST